VRVAMVRPVSASEDSTSTKGQTTPGPARQYADVDLNPRARTRPSFDHTEGDLASTAPDHCSPPRRSIST
jgi:hypothetical protein